MGINFNYKGFGSEQAGETSGNERPPGIFPLSRESSLYSLTFDGFQSSVGGIGSINMDELLKNVWSAEESNNNIGSTSGACAGAGDLLQRQGSMKLGRSLSQKKVDQVWRELLNDQNGNNSGINLMQMQSTQTQREPTLGETTLEEFLLMSGVVAEETTKPESIGFFGNLSNNSNTGFIYHQAGVSNNGNSVSYGSSIRVGNSNEGRGLNGVSIGGGSPFNRFTRNNDEHLHTQSPVPYSYARGRRTVALEKVVERRQRRMIKNRESAARSRARKQAYTVDLEAEVAKLKEANEVLIKKQAELMEIQKKQVVEIMKQQKRGNKRRCLKRSQTGVW